MESLTLDDLDAILPEATHLNSQYDQPVPYRPRECPSRRVVAAEKDGVPLIIKYGTRVSPVEAATTSFVANHTSVRVPKIYCVLTDTARSLTYIVEERLPGQTLEDAFPTLDSVAIHTNSLELREVFTELSSLSPHRDRLGPLSGPWANAWFFPFLKNYPISTQNARTTRDLIAYFHAIKGYTPLPGRVPLEELLVHFDLSRPPLFSHGDLQACNIMVEDGHVIGIIDWSEAGWYPYFWNSYVLEKSCFQMYKVPEWKRMIAGLCTHFPEEVELFKKVWGYAGYYYI